MVITKHRKKSKRHLSRHNSNKFRRTPSEVESLRQYQREVQISKLGFFHWRTFLNYGERSIWQPLIIGCSPIAIVLANFQILPILSKHDGVVIEGPWASVLALLFFMFCGAWYLTTLYVDIQKSKSRVYKIIHKMNFLLFIAVSILLFLEYYLFSLWVGVIFCMSYLSVATEFKEKN